MKDYTQEELNMMFVAAIEDMAAKGIVGPEETKRLLANIKQWLIEMLEV